MKSEAVREEEEVFVSEENGISAAINLGSLGVTLPKQKPF